jgi:hypothetical protein
MMLKTVYGPPPPDAERIEGLEVQWENAVIESNATNDDKIIASPKKNRNGMECPKSD